MDRLCSLLNLVAEAHGAVDLPQSSHMKIKILLGLTIPLKGLSKLNKV